MLGARVPEPRVYTAGQGTGAGREWPQPPVHFFFRTCSTYSKHTQHSTHHARMRTHICATNTRTVFRPQDTVPSCAPPPSALTDPGLGLGSPLPFAPSDVQAPGDDQGPGEPGNADARMCMCVCVRAARSLRSSLECLGLDGKLGILKNRRATALRDMIGSKARISDMVWLPLVNKN